MRKIYILYNIVTISILSLVYINNTSALDYSSNVGIGFTFNPTLSISLSSSDLVISNLVPGSTLDSNVINVSVASNASYGYTLSAIVNGNNGNLTHSNNTNVFSSIATNADLSSLENSEDTNIWGYSYKDNTVETPTWSNYNGLSSSNNTALINTNSNVSSNLDFKIAAKAASTQASGTYTGVINFTAVTKLTPLNLAESYFAAGKTRHNGYYAMQDMTSEICNNTEVIGEGSQTELIDLRDDKVYWATKLADGHCWMTQNLDLDLDSSRTYTHWDTDLGWNTENSNILDENATWKPLRSTVDFTGTGLPPGYNASNSSPYSANPGHVYYYTSNSEEDDTIYNSLQEYVNANDNKCSHYHVGNYYNWSAAVANNDTGSLTEQYTNSPNSICPKGWKIPSGTSTANNDFVKLFDTYNISTSSYNINKFIFIRTSPLYLTRGGALRYWNGGLLYPGSLDLYWSTVVFDSYRAYIMQFNNDNFYPFYEDNNFSGYRNVGISLRCLAR